MTIIFYATMQLIKLKNFGEPAIMTSVRDNYFESTDEFTTKEGLFIAFALSDYTDDTEPIEDASYGQLKAYYKTWGLDENQGVNFEPLASRQCTKEQLGLTKGDTNKESKSLFFPLHKQSKSDLEFYYKRF